MIIFVQPAFEDMDKDVRMRRLRLWIDVITRGVGILYKPIKSLGGGSDPWNLEKNDKLIVLGEDENINLFSDACLL